MQCMPHLVIHMALVNHVNNKYGRDCDGDLHLTILVQDFGQSMVLCVCGINPKIETEFFLSYNHIQ